MPPAHPRSDRPAGSGVQPGTATGYSVRLTVTPPDREIAPFTPPLTPAATPARQLSDLPADELAALAEELGLEMPRTTERQALVAAIHGRRQLIALLERDALLEVVRWGRRPVTANATKEQIAREIARVRSMRFAGLSHRGLLALARLRGLPVTDADPVPAVVKKLKRKEGIFSRLGRQRRALVGSLIARIVGEDPARQEYHYLPPSAAPSTTGSSAAPQAPRSPASLKEEIEEVGLLGGLTNRVKRSADSYLNQKLDEIESRIDRKLDEIDRRLGEWRDKEIANRIRILKITLWASVVVGIVSLIYAYLKAYAPFLFGAR